MKRLTFWLSAAIVSFCVGIVFVLIWKYILIPDDIKPLPQICATTNFPGKSVLLENFKPQDRSVYEDNGSFPETENKFFSAFKEEKFELKFSDENRSSEIKTADEIYRFFWLRTFHNPMMIKVYKIGDEKFIVSKKLSGRSGYESGNLVFDKERKLSDEEWCEFINLLDKFDFWNKEKIKTDSLAEDGAMWIIEGVNEQRYYSAGEQSPETGNFRNACIYLMKISSLNINENEREFY